VVDRSISALHPAGTSEMTMGRRNSSTEAGQSLFALLWQLPALKGCGI